MMCINHKRSYKTINYALFSKYSKRAGIMRREDGEKIENSSYSVFSPKCCQEHKDATTKKRHMETSEWIFENDPVILQDKNFDPWNRSMPSTQHKIKCMEEIDQKLEHDTRQALIEEIKEVSAEDSNEDIPRKEFDLETSYSEPVSGRNEEEAENLKNLKESIKDVSPYLILLNRLDEEEGVRTPSIEDKLKLAEDRLRISTTQFCKACEELIYDKDDSNVTEEYAFLSPEKVQEAFRPKVFEPSLRPPQTLSVSEVSKKPIPGISETAGHKKENRKEMKKKEVFKQGFYLPCDTWFQKEKEAPRLSAEELDILNSTSTKAFLKFLEERKKSPPKVLQEIQKKLQSMKTFEKPG